VVECDLSSYLPSPNNENNNQIISPISIFISHLLNCDEKMREQAAWCLGERW